MDLRRGIDEFGLVHYDSKAKRTYIWPVCGTSHLCLRRTLHDAVVTYLPCIDGRAQHYEP